MDDAGKRKRLLEQPRITYQYGNRTFARLFNGELFLLVRSHSSDIDVEQSLSDTKDVVRKKLGLPMDADIRLSQLREDTVVDLEDGLCPRPSATDATPLIPS